METKIPEVSSPLRQKTVTLPDIMKSVSGIKILGKTIKTLIFTTDVAIIRNNNADAILAIYPFTPQPVISQAITAVADKPVLMGIGGGTTQGKRIINLALHAEFQGAMAVVLNGLVGDAVLKAVDKTIDIPIVVTVFNSNVEKRLQNGADILNVSAGSDTPRVVEEIRAQYPDIPIIATGGPTEESIAATIASGANALTYTPPSSGELFKSTMEIYRKNGN